MVEKIVLRKVRGGLILTRRPELEIYTAMNIFAIIEASSRSVGRSSGRRVYTL